MFRRNLFLLVLLLLGAGTNALCQSQDAPQQDQQQPTQQQGQRGSRRGQGDGPPPLMGKITALKNGTLELTKQDGTAVTVKLTDKTEFRKDRQTAKMADFKVGDMVFIRGEQNPDQTVTAAVVAARNGNGPGGGQGGRGFGGAGGAAPLGELGKDYIAGEVKSVDAPKLTVLRSDNVTQTIELTEDTSLRKGRDSITMADIQPGDHVVARGALQNNAFAPKTVMIFSSEQWQRMQEMGTRRRGAGESAPANAPAAAPPAAAPPNPPQQ